MALLVRILVYTVIFILILHSAAPNENNYISEAAIKVIKNDLPSFIDLMVYLPLINRIVDFCETHKSYMNINLAYGLFLVNVNLQPFAEDNNIPQSIRNDLSKLVARISHIRDIFIAGGGKMRGALAILSDNATLWSSRLIKLNVNLLRKTYAVTEYPLWKDYLRAVENVFKGTPTPVESDKCIEHLSHVPLRESAFNLVPRCDLPDKCIKYIVNGTDFGYSLTHRHILLHLARFGRGCAIFSPHEDNLFRINFCEKAYREAQFIALNDFQLMDLMLEQIALCSIDGHAQFLRRSWLINLLSFQQTTGCFQQIKVRQNSENISECDEHVTSVSAATYAAASRFLLEKMKRLI